MPVVIPLTSLIYTEFPLKHDEREVRGFSSACVSVEILCVCICLGCSSPCCGLTSDSWCLKQEIEESGLHPTVYMPDVPCCFPDTHTPIPYLSFCLSGGGFLSVTVVTSLQASGLHSAFALIKCGFSVTTPASPPPICLCTCAEHGLLRAHSCWMLRSAVFQAEAPPREATGRWRGLE